jgi:hypothetical protein
VPVSAEQLPDALDGRLRRSPGPGSGGDAGLHEGVDRRLRLADHHGLARGHHLAEIVLAVQREVGLTPAEQPRHVSLVHRLERIFIAAHP